jgi:hypothetical protein
MINGIYCHETGCPNANSRYDFESAEWVKQVKCWECGYDHDEHTLCCVTD